MKRLHVHVTVDALEPSLRYYTTLFDHAPTVVKPDYAKWLLDDPRVNFAISTRGAPGLDHLGLQVDAAEELAEVGERLHAAGEPARAQIGASCCYARSDKQWSHDPSGIAWGVFHTVGEITTYGQDRGPRASACCAPGADAIEGAACAPQSGRCGDAAGACC